MSIRVPAEWEQHSACWIAWPCRYSIWPDYNAACKIYAQIINTISEFEPVKLLVKECDYKFAKKFCSHVAVEFVVCKLNDSWARDIMPVFAIRSSKKELIALNWQFNAWGEKFIDYQHDNNIAKYICENLNSEYNLHLKNIQHILEGGAISVNGDGLLLTTKSVLLNDNRNKHIEKSERLAVTESLLCEHLGVSDIIWLNEGLVGDVDTDGHVDNVAVFVKNNMVLMQSSKDVHSDNFCIYRDVKNCLQNTNLDIVEVQEPDHMQNKSYKHKLLTSYVNFYFANQAIIMPSFSANKHDDLALGIMQDLFPARKIIQINVLDLIIGGGGIHCITSQQPLL